MRSVYPTFTSTFFAHSSSPFLSIGMSQSLLSVFLIILLLRVLFITKKSQWNGRWLYLYNLVRIRATPTIRTDSPIPLNKPVMVLRILLLVRHFHRWVEPSTNIGICKMSPTKIGMFTKNNKGINKYPIKMLKQREQMGSGFPLMW